MAGFAGTMLAADLQELRRSCFQRASLSVGRHWMEQCAIDIVTLRPVHPAFQSIAPGTGTGLGVGFDQILRRSRIEIIPSAKILVSTDRSLLADARLTVGFPGVSLIRETGPFASAPIDPSEERDPYLHRLALVSGNPAIDAKAAFTVCAQRLELQRQDFYGLGPSTTQSDLALYKSRQTSAGFNVTNPFSTWAAIGFSFDYLQPRVLPVLDGDRPPITDMYTEETAPGITHQPHFIRFGPDVRFRFEPTYLRFTELKAGYVFYHELDGGTYSFRRLTASSRTEYEILIQTENTASNRSALSNFLCTPRPAKECSLGILAVSANVSLSQTGSGSQIPFYFQPTLGGADMQGQDTLRGFRDFRFRAPNLMLLQAEYRRGVWGPIGFLSFVDIGRVALRPSELVVEHLRHDIGVGLYFSAGNTILLRAYVGFGTREGIRPNAKLAGSP